MPVMTAVLDAYKKTKKIPSDNALAIAINVTRQTVSQYRNGSAFPKDDRFIDLCEGAKLDPVAYLAALQADRATGIARTRWATAARKLGYAAVFCLAVYTAIGGPLASASAAELPTLHKSTVYTLHTFAKSLARFLRVRSALVFRSLTTWTGHLAQSLANPSMAAQSH